MRHTDLPAPLLSGPDVDVLGLTADSREVKPGYLFAALAGARARGSDFIGDALAHGAVAVLASADAAPVLPNRDVALIADPNPRHRLALMAAAFFGAQPPTIAAVTGTNGKTSVANFTCQIWQTLGLKAASFGTLGVITAEESRPLTHTTPDPVWLHRELAALAKAGISHLALEASSHGLDQCRLDGVRLMAGAFLNLTRDHFDYHHDADHYFEAKARLFRELLPTGTAAVLNADVPEFERLAALVGTRALRLIDFGRKADVIRLNELTRTASGQRLDLTLFGRNLTVELPLPGDFQAINALAALGLAIGCGAPPERAAEALNRLKPVRGRIECVARHPSGAPIYVDYAHTPDGLETLLNALRPHTRGRLVVVFGCGGDRDPGKRPQMGAIAARLADRVIVTDDNPRSEDAALIRRAILAACPTAQEIGERAEAIARAIHSLGTDDVLAIAGKGHERGQIVGARIIPFDDAETARHIVQVLMERAS